MLYILTSSVFFKNKEQTTEVESLRGGISDCSSQFNLDSVLWIYWLSQMIPWQKKDPVYTEPQPRWMIYRFQDQPPPCHCLFFSCTWDIFPLSSSSTSEDVKPPNSNDFSQGGKTYTSFFSYTTFMTYFISVTQVQFLFSPLDY